MPTVRSPLFLDALRHQQAGRLDEARRCWLSHLADRPGEPEALYLLALTELSLGEPAAALGRLETVVAAQPGWADAQYHRGLANHRLGRLDAAAAAYGLALRHQPDHPQARTNLESVLERQGRPAAVAELLERYVAGPGRDDRAAWQRLAFAWYRQGEWARARTILETMLDRWPQPAGAVRKGLGIVCLMQEDAEAAHAHLSAALAEDPDGVEVLDGLAHAAGRLGRWAEARRHGGRALLLKAQRRAGGDGAPPPPVGPDLSAPPPPFDPARRGANIISFSLWGDGPAYLEGAVANARLAPHLFPEWTCRFHHDDTVPAAVLAELVRQGAELVAMPRPLTRFDGLFWRFLPAWQPGVDRFLVRDCDSVLSVREREAVREWLAGDRPFHVMRDWYTHTDLMMAGLWGGVGGRLPDLRPLAAAMLEAPGISRKIDQEFLEQHVWPLIRDHALVHDGWFTLPGTRPFPPGARLWDGAHVGQNAAVWPDARHPARWRPVDVPAAADPVTPPATPSGCRGG